jgi:phosphate starvation-inducible PhoH-like protein
MQNEEGRSGAPRPIVEPPDTPARDRGLPPKTLEPAKEVTLTLSDNRSVLAAYGQYDQNLAKIERKLGVSIHVNGNHVTIKGPPEASGNAQRALVKIYERARSGQNIGLGDIDGAIAESIEQGTLFPSQAQAPVAPFSFQQIATRKKGVVRARNATQHEYLRALRQHELVFAEGPAGTGKTWLAVGHAVLLLEQGIVERLILSRPAVEAGERLGFLPGDMREKVDPYLRPIFDALNDFMDARIVERGLATGMIEVAPLAFMRGRTLTNACILLDEAQNATSMQMKMFLTRLGEGSRMIINGDPTQIDLPPGQKSGLREAVGLLSGLEGIGHVVFKDSDVVRHDIVRRIVTAYENAERINSGRRDGTGPRDSFGPKE